MHVLFLTIIVCEYEAHQLTNGIPLFVSWSRCIIIMVIIMIMFRQVPGVVGMLMGLHFRVSNHRLLLEIRVWVG